MPDKKIIAIAQFWEQPPIETSARIFTEAKSFSRNIKVGHIWDWAINQTNNYVKLSSLKITLESS